MEQKGQGDWNSRSQIQHRQEMSTVHCWGDKCDVCLSEKLAIMKDKDRRSINKRTEVMNKCRHKWRQKLAGNRKL